MPNIFDGLYTIEDDVIIQNIAILESANMGNAMKGYGTTIANKGAKFLNFAGGLIGKKPNVKEIEEKRIDDYIKEKTIELRGNSRYELEERLKANLIKKVSGINKSDDAISVAVIEFVSKKMKLGENMTTAQKADSIHRRYFEKVLNELQVNLKNQNEEEEDKTIKEIEKSLQGLSEKEKEDLQEVLSISNLSGKEIRNALVRGGAPLLIIGGLSSIGFSAFIALTTIMHAIFTTVLGITLPFTVYTTATSLLGTILGPVGIIASITFGAWQFKKGNRKLDVEILGLLVFTAVSASGGSFVAKNESLPSYISDKEILKKIKTIDMNYNKLEKENNELKEELNRSNESINDLNENIELYKYNIQCEEEKRISAETIILDTNKNIILLNKKLKESKDQINDLENRIKTSNNEELQERLESILNDKEILENKISNLNYNIEYQNNLIEDASNEIEEKKEQIKSYDNNRKNLIYENKELKDKLEIYEKKLEKTELGRRKEISKKWNLYYPQFDITNSAVRGAGKFSKEEIWEIERALIELHSLKDFKSISRGKMDGIYEHIGFSLPSGFPTRILYTITNHSNKKVRIEKIYKHNENIYK